MYLKAYSVSSVAWTHLVFLSSGLLYLRSEVLFNSLNKSLLPPFNGTVCSDPGKLIVHKTGHSAMKTGKERETKFKSRLATYRKPRVCCCLILRPVRLVRLDFKIPPVGFWFCGVN